MKTILVDAAGTFVIKGKGIYKPLYKLLEKYPNKKIILTNANNEELVQYGLVDLPYEMFTLQHSPDKVAPKYFQKMLKHFGLTPKDVVYFEHSPEAVASAQSLGIAAHYYDPAKKDLAALKDFLDKNI